MYSHQMLCLVTTAFAPNVQAALDNGLRTRLDLALRGLAFVHFASIALLPSQPGEATKPSLLLELVIDDGIDPQQAVGRLVDQHPGILWALYMNVPASGNEVQMRLDLRTKLLPLVSTALADSGFIGMRDRTVTQVRAEARYFLAAREAMRRLRDAAIVAGEQPSAQLLVQRLIAALASDPGRAAMQPAPARSFWCRKRPFPWQLLLALIWVGLPVPLLLVALATVGAVFNAAVMRLPFGTAYFLLVASAATVLLFGVFTLVGLMRLGGISMSMLVVSLSALGVAALYVLLVGNFARVIGSGGFAGESAWLAAAGVAAVLATVIGVWTWVLRHADAPTRHRAFGVGAVLGAAIVASMLGMILRDSLGARVGPSWQWPFFGVCALLIALAFESSGVVRWMLALACLLVPALLLLFIALAAAGWPGILDLVWRPNEIVAYVAFGLLAPVSLALLVGVLFSARALWTLRSPWWPLGIPLLVLTLLFAALSVGAGALGIAVYERLCRPVPSGAGGGLPAFLTYSFWLTLALACAAVFVLAVQWLARSALPALVRLGQKLDQADPDGEPLRPCILPESILANEAGLFDRPCHMISLTEVRGHPGGWSAHMLRLWLHIIGQSGHVWYTRGLLGTARGIKYAHWHLLDEGRRLLFISNFDGDFGGYLDEFIRGTSQGINLIWRSTELRKRNPAAQGQPEVDADRDFPSTVKWAFNGCHQEQHFKAYTRASMLPHLYLFQAYQNSNADIQRATQLREALAGERTLADDDLILRILES